MFVLLLNERNWCTSLQCIFIYNHKDTSITLKASADITYNNEQHVRISLFDASSWPIVIWREGPWAHCKKIFPDNWYQYSFIISQIKVPLFRAIMALWMLILLSVLSEVKFNSPDVEMNKNVSIRNRTLLQVYIELKVVPGGAFRWSRQTKLAIFSIKGHNSGTI